MDPLLEAALAVVCEKKKAKYLNDCLRFEIAERMVNKNKLGEEVWLESQIEKSVDQLRLMRKEAKKRGYHPFIQFDGKYFTFLKSTYGEAAIKLLAKLQDPEKISKRWALHFCATASAIGFDVCLQQADVYKFVTEHELWKEHKKARKMFKAAEKKGEVH